MRTPEEIREEIEKVEAAEKQARRKVLRCEARLIELQEELQEGEERKMRAQECREALRQVDIETRQEFVSRLNRVLEMATSSEIKCVRIDERDDDENEDHICRLVICYHYGPESRINIELNSITATFKEFCRFVADGEASVGTYMYHGKK